MASPRFSIIITGGTAGLGYFAARDIAKAHPDYLIVLASRSDGDQAASRINEELGQENVIYKTLDLSDSTSVRTFAENWTGSSNKALAPIQALLLNAGLQFPGALEKTAEGIERTFAISYLGHAQLFHLLCPHLAPNARVVVTSSGTHDPAQKTGLPDAVYTTAEDLAYPPPSAINIPGRKRYSSTKLAQVMWTYALDRRLKDHASDRGITITAMDPGLMPGTGLARVAPWYERILWFQILPRIVPFLNAVIGNVHTPEESGEALARLAIGNELDGVSGKYFEGKKEIKSSKDSYNESKQEELWNWTVNYLAHGNDSEKAAYNGLH